MFYSFNTQSNESTQIRSGILWVTTQKNATGLQQLKPARMLYCLTHYSALVCTFTFHSQVQWSSILPFVWLFPLFLPERKKSSPYISSLSWLLSRPYCVGKTMKTGKILVSTWFFCYSRIPLHLVLLSFTPFVLFYL